MAANNGSFFTARYDTVTKILSGSLCVFLLAAMLAIHNLFVGAFLILTLFLAYAYSPRGYFVADRTIIVQRLVGDIRIPLENARELRRVVANDLRGCIRLWGSGGLFGYYGLFRTSKFGRCTWYATDRRSLVVLIGERKTTIYSPDDLDGFIAAIRQEVSIPPPPSVADHAPPVASAWMGNQSVPRIVVGIAFVMAFGGMLVAMVAMRYSPGQPRYTLSRDALAIHDRFYPVTLKANAVDVDGIRVIDLDAESDWMPEVRTKGFSNTYYHSGWYRLRNGLTVRLYRADGARLVYLPSSNGDAPVLLQAADPDRLVSDIEAEWRYRK